jgi:hypothetical protein
MVIIRNILEEEESKIKREKDINNLIKEYFSKGYKIYHNLWSECIRIKEKRFRIKEESGLRDRLSSSIVIDIYPKENTIEVFKKSLEKKTINFAKEYEEKFCEDGQQVELKQYYKNK